MKCLSRFDYVSMFVHVCVCFFGCGTWITTTAIFVELPILVESVPESWDIGAYLTLIIQVANIGPLLYTLSNYLFPKNVTEKLVVYLIVFVGASSSLLLAFFWDVYTVIGGSSHSTALFILQFFSAAANCTSAVVFLPFMSIFPPSYMISFFIGQGLSGFFPGILALAQGVEMTSCENATNPENISVLQKELFLVDEQSPQSNFSPRTFFCIISVMSILCGISFTLLNYLPVCKARHMPSDASETSNKNVEPSSEVSPLLDDSSRSHTTLTVTWKKSNQTVTSAITKEPAFGISTSEFMTLLISIACVRALENGIVPSIQTYAFLPYGMEPYSLAVDLSRIADPVVCFLAFFVPINSVRSVVPMAVISCCLCGYIVVLASLSPTPHLMDSDWGSALAVMSQVLATGSLTYAKVSIAGVFRSQGKRSLFFCGAASQIGSFTGALLMFLLVNIFEVFIKAANC